VIASYRILII